MAGPLDNINDIAIRPSASSAGQRVPITTNISAWGDTSVETEKSNRQWWVLTTHLPMYAILILSGWWSVTGFFLDPWVLVTLVGTTVGISAPYYIRMAINVTRSQQHSTP